MKHGPSIAAILALTALGATVAQAQPQSPPATPSAPASPASKPAEKPVEKTTAPAADATAPPTTPAPAAAPAAAPDAVHAAPKPPVLPNAELAKIIEQVRKSPLGTESNVVAYLDRISTGTATAAQVNDLSAYIAKRGGPKIAAVFQEHALHLDATNATLWLNLGTIRRTNGQLGPAATAFKKAIELEPVNALAHYNLGAVYDAEKNYDAAIEEYKRALVLDPALADPRKNPQVVNNENMLAVKLQIYQNQAGSLGLPLLQMQKPKPAPKAPPDKP